MNSSKDTKFRSSIDSSVDRPLRIRTNKHRAFVFCLGHRSLTCVPGIGKKNKYLLNQSGIYDLSTLYRKYRSINDLQRFQQWLERKIGFTSYQAKMTACGIGSKLGEIKEINTGLTPIRCPSQEKRKRSEENDEKQNVKEIKLEKLSPNSTDTKSIESSSPLVKDEVVPLDSFPMHVKDLTKTKKLNKISSLTNQKWQLTSAATNQLSSIPTHSNTFIPQNLHPMNTDTGNEQKQAQVIESESSNESTAIIERPALILPLSKTRISPTKSEPTNGTSRHSDRDNKREKSISKTEEKKFHEEINRTISEIMRQAASIVRNDIQSPTNQTLITKIQPKKSPSIDISSSRNKDQTLQLNERISLDDNLPNLLRKTKMHDERLPKQQSPTIKNFPPAREVSTKKSSVTTLSSLSDSDQSIDKIRLKTTEKNRLDGKMLINTNPDGINKFKLTSHSLTASSSNIIQLPTEHGEQTSFATTTRLDLSQRKESENPIAPANHPNLSSDLNDIPSTNKNLSKIGYSKDNSASQSTDSPSSPLPCYAIWDNVSNEQILSQRGNRRRTLLREKTIGSKNRSE